jgi:membrane peptidoglycan carboxypeptidase
MARAEWRGSIAGQLRFQTDSRELDKTVLNVNITDRCSFEVVPVLADLSRFAGPFVHSVTEPDGTVFEMETGPGTENWTPIEQMSPYLVHAVLVHEDPQFFNHHGFSPLNIRNALVRDLKERRYAVGASTISMQLVKNVFLHREKTLARKIQEVLLTWWTERVMEKRDILELYLNVIEYGPSIYGIRNAAQHYWNRTPAELSPGESVFLANILPNPKHFHSYYQRNALSASWASGLKRFLQRLGERGAYDKEATDFGLEELDHFHFARPGHAPEPRTIAGSAAPLPYQQAAQAARDQLFEGGQTNTNTVRMQPLN